MGVVSLGWGECALVFDVVGWGGGAIMMMRGNVWRRARAGRGRGRVGAGLPLLLLVLAVAAVYLSGDGWGHFRRHLPSHDGDSAKNLAIAENLSPAHSFRLFLRLYPGDGGGDAVYEMYGRFPIGSYALIKLAIAPFGDNLSAKLHAARVLMLLMFAGAAALAYQSLRRITGRRSVALAATLLAFSSYYVLFYNDMVANEIIMDLFAVLLVFHGMTVFVQERRFGQLWVKTGIAILLGWHVYALLLPFIVLGLGGELIRAARRAQSLSLGAAAGGVRRIYVYMGAKCLAAKCLGSRYLILGVAALLFGLAVLGFNFVNEYTAYKGEVPLRQLPSVQSMLKRLGQDAEYSAAQSDALEWRRFLAGQLRRIGRMALPYAASVYTDGLHGWHPRGGIGLPYLPLGMTALGACLLGALLAPRYRGLLATLALSGVVWGVLVRHNTSVHNYESIFYIGVPLVLFAAVLWHARRRWGGRALGVAAAAALVIFALSGYQMNRTDALGQDPATQAALMSDFGTIRGITRGHRVFIPAAELAPAVAWRGAPAVTPPVDTRVYSITERLLNYYFAGSVMQIENKLLYGCGADCGEVYDFAVSMERRETPALLTPGNRLVFLYAADGVAPMQEAQRREIVAGEPAVRADFDLYLGDGRLAYYKEACGAADVAERFFLHLYPADPADLAGGRQRYGFESIGFEFQERGAMAGGECLATVALPDYGLSRIRTGQWIRGAGELWEAEIVPETVSGR